jgi:hypothetical protein
MNKNTSVRSSEAAHQATHQGLVDARWVDGPTTTRATHISRAPSRVAHMHAALGLNYTLKSR